MASITRLLCLFASFTALLPVLQAQQLGALTVAPPPNHRLDIRWGEDIYPAEPVQELRFRNLPISQYRPITIDIHPPSGPIQTLDLQVPLEANRTVYYEMRLRPSGDYIAERGYAGPVVPSISEAPRGENLETYGTPTGRPGNPSLLELDWRTLTAWHRTVQGQLFQLRLQPINTPPGTGNPGGPGTGLSGAGYAGPNGCPQPVSPSEYNQQLQEVRGLQNDYARYTLVRSALERYCFTSIQVRGLLEEIGQERQRLELAEFAYPYVFDCENFVYVMDAFQFSNTARELDEYLQAHRGDCGNGQLPVFVDPQPTQPQPVLPPNPVPSYTGPIGCEFPSLPQSEFQAALQSVRSNSFASTRKTVALQVINRNCFTVRQVQQMVEVFDFESDRLEVAKAAYPHTFDINNYHLLQAAFSFESNVEELSQFVGQKPIGRPNPWVGAPGPYYAPAQPFPHQNPGFAPQGFAEAPTLQGPDWTNALRSVSSQDFARTQKQVASQLLAQNRLTTQQVQQLIDVFDFEKDRLEIAKQAYASCIDPQNYHLLYSSFEFERNVEELSQFVQQH